MYYNTSMKKRSINFIKIKSYWKEILLVLILKAVFLTILYYSCFSKPPLLDDQKAGEHLLY